MWSTRLNDLSYHPWKDTFILVSTRKSLSTLAVIYIIESWVQVFFQPNSSSGTWSQTYFHYSKLEFDELNKIRPPSSTLIRCLKPQKKNLGHGGNRRSEHGFQSRAGLVSFFFYCSILLLSTKATRESRQRRRAGGKRRRGVKGGKTIFLLQNVKTLGHAQLSRVRVALGDR